MKTLIGVSELVGSANSLPRPAWIFVGKGVDRADAQALLNAFFYIPQTDEESFYGEDNLLTLVETPILNDIIELLDERANAPSVNEYAEAIAHYVVHDAFLT